MWDFSTEPDLQAHLDWTEEVVREEIWPLETLDLDLPQLVQATAPRRERVKERRLDAAHLDPELGGQGFDQINHVVQRLGYRFARGARLSGGSHGIHRQSVARQVLRGYEPSAVPSGHVPTRCVEARERFAHLLEAVTGNA